MVFSVNKLVLLSEKVNANDKLGVNRKLNDNENLKQHRSIRHWRHWLSNSISSINLFNLMQQRQHSFLRTAQKSKLNTIVESLNIIVNLRPNYDTYKDLSSKNHYLHCNHHWVASSYFFKTVVKQLTFFENLSTVKKTRLNLNGQFVWMPASTKCVSVGGENFIENC